MSITLTVRADNNGEIHVKHPLISPGGEVELTCNSVPVVKSESFVDLISRLRAANPNPPKSIEEIEAEIREMRRGD